MVPQPWVCLTHVSIFGQFPATPHAAQLKLLFVGFMGTNETQRGLFVIAALKPIPCKPARVVTVSGLKLSPVVIIELCAEHGEPLVFVHRR